MSFKHLPVERPELRELGRVLGAERIGKIVRKFYGKMHDDVLIGFFFTGKDLDLIASRQTSFLLRAMGLTQSYTGHAPADAHTSLAPILEGHFDRRLKLLEEVLTHEGLTDAQTQTWIAFENAFRDAIVRKSN